MIWPLVLLLVIFGGLMGLSVLTNGQRLYIRNPIVPVLYFGTGSYIVFLLFPAIGEFFSLASIGIILSALCISIALYALARQFLQSPTTFLQEHGDKNAFTLLAYPFVVGKGSEIFFQQVCLVGLVITLASNVNMGTLSLVVAGAMLVTHIPLLLTHGVKWGGLYILLGGGFGFLLPWIILTGANGLAYVFALHMLAYVVGGCLVWIYQARNVDVV